MGRECKFLGFPFASRPVFGVNWEYLSKKSREIWSLSAKTPRTGNLNPHRGALASPTSPLYGLFVAHSLNATFLTKIDFFQHSCLIWMNFLLKRRPTRLAGVQARAAGHRKMFCFRLSWRFFLVLRDWFWCHDHLSDALWWLTYVRGGKRVFDPRWLRVGFVPFSCFSQNIFTSATLFRESAVGHSKTLFYFFLVNVLHYRIVFKF